MNSDDTDLPRLIAQYRLEIQRQELERVLAEARHWEEAIRQTLHELEEMNKGDTE